MERMNKRLYRVVLTDADYFPLDETHLETLSQAQIEVIGTPYGLPEDELSEQCKDADALLVFAAKITAKVIEKAEKLSIIARCGTGYDNIDIQFAASRNITVTSVPDFCSEEVSDHTLALMLDCWRKLSFSRLRVMEGHWDNYRKLGTMYRIQNQKVGLLGFGRIAQKVARKLSGFGVEIAAYDPYTPSSIMETMGVKPMEMDEVLSRSDVVSIHMPLLTDTGHIMNRNTFEKMKDGAIFINTSRGPLVNEDDLFWALNSGKLSAASLDVLEKEPPAPDHPLIRLPQVTMTPHSAAYSDEAISDVKSQAINEVVRKLQRLLPLHPVIAPSRS